MGLSHTCVFLNSVSRGHCDVVGKLGQQHFNDSNITRFEGKYDNAMKRTFNSGLTMTTVIVGSPFSPLYEVYCSIPHICVTWARGRVNDFSTLPAPPQLSHPEGRYGDGTNPFNISLHSLQESSSFAQYLPKAIMLLVVGGPGC